MKKLICPHCDSSKNKQTHYGSVPRFSCDDCGKSFRQTVALAYVEPLKLNGKRYVVTSAVSGSYVHPPFLRTLEKFCLANNSQLLVIPIRYHNPTSRFENPGDWFDDRVLPYLYEERAELCNGLTIMSDIPTQPTAARPLSGVQTMSGENSAIFGHTKIALESISTRVGKHAKIVCTTGAVTRPEYSSSKAGKKGEFHHVLGAVIVEVDPKGFFHLRHIHGNSDGSFYDINKKYTETGVEDASVKVLTVGDLHAKRADPSVLEATFFAKNSIVQTVKPAKIILHDVLDFHSASHHNTFFQSFGMYHKKANETNVESEVQLTLEVIDRIAAAAPWAEIFVVASNHDDHFVKWLENPNNAHDKENSLFYHDSKAAMLRAIKEGKDSNPLAIWAKKFLDNGHRIKFLKADESLMIDKIEYAQHGNKGPNGVKGAISTFLKVGARLVIGHSHTPGIMDGVYQVGTSSLMNMGYNKGLSSWMHTHALSYTNGKRTLVNIVNGLWQA